MDRAPDRSVPSERVTRVAQAMRIDSWTVAVLGAMRGAGVRPVLLKGPVVAAWLYGGDRAARSYNDADILVAPTQVESARRVLADLGFGCDAVVGSGPLGAPARHAECWFREADHAAVDLHQHLHSTEQLDASEVWAIVARDAETMDLQGIAVEVPSEAMRALHVVLHLRPKDHPGSQAWEDLSRAIDQVDASVWEAARGLAVELQVEAEMGALLRLLPSGGAVADRLQLPHRAPRYLVLEHDPSAPGAARFVERARALGAFGAARMAVRKAFPAPDDVRRGWPIARRGPVHLVAVYAWRLLLVPVRLGQWARFYVASRSTGLRQR